MKRVCVPVVWLVLCVVSNSQSSQPTEPFKKCSVEQDGKIRVVDNEPWCTLEDKNYCVQAVKMLSVGKEDQSNEVKIEWKGNSSLLSIEVGPADPSDEYCDPNPQKHLNHTKTFTPDDRSTSWTAVHNEKISTSHLPLLLDCSYTITVTPMDRSANREVTFLYRMPECIIRNSREVCHCRQTNNLPVPKILSTISENNGVFINWSLPVTELSDNVFKIIFFVQHGGEVAYNKTINFTSNDVVKKTNSFKTFIELPPTNLTLSYLATLYAVDKQACPSKKTEYYFKWVKNIVVAKEESLWITLVILLLVLLSMTLLAVLWRHHNNCSRVCKKIRSCGTIPAVPLMNNPSYITSSRELPHSFDHKRFRFLQELGSGLFGVVRKAEYLDAIGGKQIFAVKIPKHIDDVQVINDFKEEQDVFLKAGFHENIVRMLGYCEAPNHSIIMEFLPGGSLNEYLKNLRVDFDRRRNAKGGDPTYSSSRYVTLVHPRTLTEEQIEDESNNYISDEDLASRPLNTAQDSQEMEIILDHTELQSFSLQIARGMEHLEKMCIVHRDLATRNVLIGQNKVLKISDFGLSKNTSVYVNKTKRKLPWRWMALESMRSNIFTSKSDVWSYGVVLWEIGSLAALPYAGTDDDLLLSYLLEGNRLCKSENISEELYNIMMDCWEHSPNNRPSFSDLVKKIERLGKESNTYIDFEELKTYKLLPVSN